VRLCLVRYVAAPVNVLAPQVSVTLGGDLQLTWQAPDLYTGPVTRYVLTAYNLDVIDALPLATNVTSLHTSGQSTVCDAICRLTVHHV